MFSMGLFMEYYARSFMHYLLQYLHTLIGATLQRFIIEYVEELIFI